MVSKTKKIIHPYLSFNLDRDTQFIVIAEDKPISRCANPDFWGGNNQADTYPSTVPLRYSSNPNATQWARRRLSKEWMIYVREINAQNDIHAVTNTFKTDAGWINGAEQQIDPWQIENMDASEMPKPDIFTTSGNVHVIDERTSNAVRLRTFGLQDAPPDPADFNHQTAAAFVVHMMATHKAGHYVNISSGSGYARDVYFPLMCPGDAWVHFSDKWCDDRVEFFPNLGNVTANTNVTVRAEPDTSGDYVDTIKAGWSVNLLQYYPTYNGIWARVSNGWIAIQYLPRPGSSYAKYFTDWRLDSIPALRPNHYFD